MRPPLRRGRPRPPPDPAPRLAAAPSAILRALVQHRDALHVVHQHAHRVLDPDHREAELVAHAADELRRGLHFGRGEARRDFVEQQHARPRAERHADLEQPLPRRRQAPAGSARHLAEPEEAEDRARRRRTRRARDCARGRRTRGRTARSARRSCPGTRAASGTCARRRACAKTCAGRPVRSSPPSRSRPAVGASTPESAWKKVVLPAPFGPIMPTSSPLADLELDRVDGDEAAEAHGDALSPRAARQPRAPPFGAAGARRAPRSAPAAAATATRAARAGRARAGSAAPRAGSGTGTGTGAAGTR